MANFSEESLAKLATCHPDLQRLFNEVVKQVDCTILCGHRGQLEQDAAYATGHSREQWPHGKHNATPSLAVDVSPYPIIWGDTQRFKDFAATVKAIAASLGITVVWGGDWLTFKDYPHWQIAES